MKRILTLVLCWLISFEAFAVTGTNFNFNVGKTSKVAGGYVTSLNKVDGSFENGTTGWSASVGTITATASTEFQGNFKGVWAGTGTGTIDLQWTATASNTYEASVMFRSPVADSDHYICAYVGTTETGCTLIDGPDYAVGTIRTVKVVADSVMSSAFYLRLKHTGSDAFSVEVDNGKIQPWTPEMGQTVEQESITYTGYTSKNPSNYVKFKTILKDSGSVIVEDNNTGDHTKFTIKRKSLVNVVGGVAYSGTTNHTVSIIHFNSSGTRIIEQQNVGTYSVATPHTIEANIGDYFVVYCNNVTPIDDVTTIFSITATAIRDNVVTTYSEDSVGEILYSINSTPKNGFISAQGSIIGNTSGTHQGSTYYNLYKYAWTYAVTTAGEPFVISSAKGASYDADWAAGKTIKIDYSGLFPRASGGNAGAVGAKQMDAFQDHNHTYSFVGGSGGTLDVGSGAAYPRQVAATGLASSGRTATETRSINSALYAYIRYAVSQPTLLALPTSKDNNKTYDLTQVSLTSSDATLSNGQGAFYPYRTISKTTGLPIWRIAFNVGVTTNSLSSFNLKISGVASPNKLQSVTNVAADGGTVANAGVFLASSDTINIAAGAPKTTWRISGDVELAAKPTWADEWVEPGVFISNLNPDGFNKTTGTTGLIDTFSFSYGTTNATTVCSASPCSYLDQIGNYVTSVVRIQAGVYVASFSKTFSKVKCTLGGAYGSGGPFVGAYSGFRCENCSSMSFSTSTSAPSYTDSYGTLICQGY